ncbi:acylneuraminate cytidylyltransferase family protein [Sporosarcina sp. GW1-11]|uniref:acylneuraminate cytidylyltransferase family protein n=1 Tax=Sporosarcina sp. GW1-11 TaxID=2899126 RepID=UPI00294F6037|nr:acylneuraminate cytidylyltransferase family protein [Sporosarcina sp. GW1-11]MDV6376980.1 acylneuraminate cytidylyltransferase family protein [Sporosarcina sp. GW1-11]
MINDKKVLAIIPARGGSKGVHRKNIRHLAGKPLIAWTIEAAKESKYIDRLILTSEDQEIIDIAKNYECEVPFIRPKELALDKTPGIDPVLHALENIPDYDYVVLLQPTSPLRITDDIDACINMLMETQSPACVSVTEAESSPYWMYSVDEGGLMHPLIKQDQFSVRRQDLPRVFSLNGAVYVADINWLQKNKTFLTKETSAYIMPRDRSYDIDNEEDFSWCEWVFNNNG